MPWGALVKIGMVLHVLHDDRFTLARNCIGDPIGSGG